MARQDDSDFDDGLDDLNGGPGAWWISLEALHVPARNELPY